MKRYFWRKAYTNLTGNVFLHDTQNDTNDNNKQANKNNNKILIRMLMMKTRKMMLIVMLTILIIIRTMIKIRNLNNNNNNDNETKKNHDKNHENTITPGFDYPKICGPFFARKHTEEACHTGMSVRSPPSFETLAKRRCQTCLIFGEVCMEQACRKLATVSNSTHALASRSLANQRLRRPRQSRR